MKVLAMMKATVRTHVVVPRDLLAAVDALVGERTRSEFVTEALQEKVARERLGKALAAAAGVLNPADYPDWEIPAKVTAWIRESRAADDRRTEAKLHGSSNV